MNQEQEKATIPFRDQKGLRNELSPEDKEAMQELFNLIIQKKTGGGDYDWFSYGCFNLSIRSAGDGRSRTGEICFGGQVFGTGSCSTIKEVAESLAFQINKNQEEPQQ